MSRAIHAFLMGVFLMGSLQPIVQADHPHGLRGLRLEGEDFTYSTCTDGREAGIMRVDGESRGEVAVLPGDACSITFYSVEIPVPMHLHSFSVFTASGVWASISVAVDRQVVAGADFHQSKGEMATGTFSPVDVDEKLPPAVRPGVLPGVPLVSGPNREAINALMAEVPPGLHDVTIAYRVLYSDEHPFEDLRAIGLWVDFVDLRPTCRTAVTDPGWSGFPAVCDVAEPAATDAARGMQDSEASADALAGSARSAAEDFAGRFHPQETVDKAVHDTCRILLGAEGCPT